MEINEEIKHKKSCSRAPVWLADRVRFHVFLTKIWSASACSSLSSSRANIKKATVGSTTNPLQKPRWIWFKSVVNSKRQSIIGKKIEFFENIYNEWTSRRSKSQIRVATGGETDDTKPVQERMQVSLGIKSNETNGSEEKLMYNFKKKPASYATCGEPLCAEHHATNAVFFKMHVQEGQIFLRKEMNVLYCFEAWK